MANAFRNAPTNGIAQGCGKTSYPSLKEARRYGARMGSGRQNHPVAKGSGAIAFYRCMFCGMYHVGHKEKR